MDTGCVVVLVTAPGEEKAAEIGRALVEEGLAACVNVLSQVRSIYRWQEKVEDEREVMMIVKTRADAFERLRAKVVSLHPYTCPEIIALPVVDGSADYLSWLGSSVR